jgi:hypothetical protein
MADALVGVTTGYTLGAVTPTAILSNVRGSPHRRLILISNLDGAIIVYVAFGTANGASASVGHPIQPGTTMVLGGPANISGQGDAGAPCPPGDISMIAASGAPKVAVTVCG